MTGTPHSDEVVVASGSGSVETIIESRDDMPLRVREIVVDYNNDGASTPTTVEIHEAPAGTAAGNLDASTRRKTIYLSAGGTAVVDAPFRQVESDLLVNPDGNHDADVAVFAGGHHVESVRE